MENNANYELIERSELIGMKCPKCGQIIRWKHVRNVFPRKYEGTCGCQLHEAIRNNAKAEEYVIPFPVYDIGENMIFNGQPLKMQNVEFDPTCGYIYTTSKFRCNEKQLLPKEVYDMRVSRVKKLLIRNKVDQSVTMGIDTYGFHRCHQPNGDTIYWKIEDLHNQRRLCKITVHGLNYRCCPKDEPRFEVGSIAYFSTPFGASKGIWVKGKVYGCITDNRGCCNKYTMEDPITHYSRVVEANLVLPTDTPDMVRVMENIFSGPIKH